MAIAIILVCFAYIIYLRNRITLLRIRIDRLLRDRDSSDRVYNLLNIAYMELDEQIETLKQEVLEYKKLQEAKKQSIKSKSLKSN
jgi:hypothetical protein